MLEDASCLPIAFPCPLRVSKTKLNYSQSYLIKSIQVIIYIFLLEVLRGLILTSYGGRLIDCVLALQFLGFFLYFFDRPAPCTVLVILAKSLPILIGNTAVFLVWSCLVPIEFLLIPRPYVVRTLARTLIWAFPRSFAILAPILICLTPQDSALTHHAWLVT